MNLTLFFRPYFSRSTYKAESKTYFNLNFRTPLSNGETISFEFNQQLSSRRKSGSRRTYKAESKTYFDLNFWAPFFNGVTISFEFNNFCSPGYALSTRVGEAQPGLRHLRQWCARGGSLFIGAGYSLVGNQVYEYSQIIRLYLNDSIHRVRFKRTLPDLSYEANTSIRLPPFINLTKPTAEALVRHRRYPMTQRTLSRH